MSLQDLLSATVPGLRGPGLTDADKALLASQVVAATASRDATADIATGVRAIVNRQASSLQAVSQLGLADGSGLILRANGTLNGWYGDTVSWTSLTRASLVSFDPSPIIAQAAGAVGTNDAGGVREGLMYQDPDGRWVYYYGAGAGPDQGQRSPWRVQYAVSRDKGLTWAKKGDLPSIGLNNGTGGMYAARDQLTIQKINGKFYAFPMTSTHTYGQPGGDQNVVPGQPYRSDIWVATDPEGPFTFVGPTGVVPGPAGGFDGYDTYTGCVVVANGKFYMFNSTTSGDGGQGGQWHIGLAVSDRVDGGYVRTGVQVLPDAIRGQPENPKVFWHVALNKWVMLTNQVQLSAGKTTFNRTFYSDSLTDWSNATYNDTQRISALDGTGAIGIPEPFHTNESVGLADGLGNFPITFDTDPTDNGAAYWHIGRREKYAIMEPATAELSGSYTAAGIAAAFADDFSETAGPLGGQNGWTDDSGGNAKPQVTADGALDMGSAVGAGVVWRAGGKNVRQIINVRRFDAGCGAGLAFGYEPGKPFYLVDFMPATATLKNAVTVYYVDADHSIYHTMTTFSRDGLVPSGLAFTASASVSSNRLVIETNGQRLVYVEADASRIATLTRGGPVALRAGSAGTGARLIESYRLESNATAGVIFADAAHASFVAKFAVRVDQLGGSADFFYRVRDGGKLDNCYLVSFDLTGNGAMGATLSKVVDGQVFVLASGQYAAEKAVAGRYMRVKVAAHGRAHRVYVEGDFQLQVIDGEHVFGQAVALRTNAGAKPAFRGGLCLYKSNLVTVTGVPGDKRVTLRAAGYVPLASGSSTDSVVTLAAPHFPAASVDVDGVDIKVPDGGIWGGDIVEYAPA